MEHKPHVSKEKKRVVSEYAKLIKEYPIIGVVDVENLPALQLGRMRQQLRGKVLVLMSKKRLIKKALEQSDRPGLAQLAEHAKGMPALLFSKESPFKLYSILKKNKSKAPIKGGQTAPNDIIIPAGPTNFAPGPVIGELGSIGVKSGIENGKVAVKADAVVAKEGTVVSAKIAGILTRMGIEPMEIGLKLNAVWDNGEILTKDVLDVDEEQYKKDFASAAAWAVNLSVNCGIYTKETISISLSKAHTDAFKLAVSKDIMTSATRDLLLAKAQAQAESLKEKIPSYSE